jgi:hypothetical protein
MPQWTIMSIIHFVEELLGSLLTEIKELIAGTGFNAYLRWAAHY